MRWIHTLMWLTALLLLFPGALLAETVKVTPAGSRPLTHGSNEEDNTDYDHAYTSDD